MSLRPDTGTVHVDQRCPVVSSLGVKEWPEQEVGDACAPFLISHSVPGALRREDSWADVPNKDIF